MDTHEFLQKRAEDVMVRDVTVLHLDDTLAQAAYTFLHKQISGAPVVGGDGKCVGVLSVTDVLGAAEAVADRQAEVTEAFFSRSELVLPPVAYREDLAAIRDAVQPAAKQPVKNFMAEDLIWIRTDDTIGRVARSFVEAHIHRVRVIDTEGKLAGLITTVDLIAALLVADAKTELGKWLHQAC